MTRLAIHHQSVVARSHAAIAAASAHAAKHHEVPAVVRALGPRTPRKEQPLATC